MKSGKKLQNKAQLLFKEKHLHLLAIASIGIFYIVTIYEGQNWSGDFSQYIHHAKNLVEGKNYLDTGYLVNFISYFNGPYAYPPIYPLMLTPIYWLFGLNLEAVKWVNIISFCFALWVCLKLFSDQLSKKQQLLLLLIMGLNPYLWYFRNTIASDYPFFLICFISLYLISKMERNENFKRNNLKRFLLLSITTGLFLYFSYGCREIGIVIPLTLLTYDLITHKKLSSITIISFLIFVFLALVQHSLLSENPIPQHLQENLQTLSKSQESPVEINHTQWISLEPKLIFERAIGYRWELQNFWPETQLPVLDTLRFIFFNIASMLAVIGYLSRTFKKISPLEIFFIGYTITLLLFGAPATIRYLIPIFPLFIFYGFIGFNLVKKHMEFKLLKYFIWGTYLSIALITFFSIKNIGHQKLDLGISHPEAKQMFQFIIDNTRKEDTIVFRKPRILALIAERKSAAYPNFKDNDLPHDMNAFFDAIEADYYIDMNLDDVMHPINLSTAPSKKFDEIFRNNYFVIYKYKTPKNKL